MLCRRLSARTIFSHDHRLIHIFSPPKGPKHFLPSSSLHFRPTSLSSSRSFSNKMHSQTIEHIVLFRVKEAIGRSRIEAMIEGLNGLASLDSVLHLTAGPVLRSGSSALGFTHMLHSRYKSKKDLEAYSAHQSHVSVVKECVLPVCDDIMAFDFVANDFISQVCPSAGSAMRVTLVKLKEGLGEKEKSDVLEAMKGMKDNFTSGSIDHITAGENFSPARAKGFSFGLIVFFREPNELGVVDSGCLQMHKVNEYLEDVIVVDYVIPSPQSACL